MGAIVVFGLCFFAMGMASQWPSRVTFRDALIDAIAAAGFKPKDIYPKLNYGQSHWSKMELGKSPLPAFDRMEDLPPAVWDELLPRIAYVVWQRRQQTERTQ